MLIGVFTLGVVLCLSFVVLAWSFVSFSAGGAHCVFGELVQTERLCTGRETDYRDAL